jgi:hypothetical protein
VVQAFASVATLCIAADGPTFTTIWRRFVSCRYCPPCDLIIAHQDEIETQLTILLSERDPSIVGNEYLVIGTLDRAIWRQSRREPMPIGELLDHLYAFAQVLQFEPEHYGWAHERWGHTRGGAICFGASKDSSGPMSIDERYRWWR